MHIRHSHVHPPASLAGLSMKFPRVLAWSKDPPKSALSRLFACLEQQQPAELHNTPLSVIWGEKVTQALERLGRHYPLNATTPADVQAILKALDHMQEEHLLFDLQPVLFGKKAWGAAFNASRAFFIYADKRNQAIRIVIKSPGKNHQYLSRSPYLRSGGLRVVKKGGTLLILENQKAEASCIVTVSAVIMNKNKEKSFSKEILMTKKRLQGLFLADNFTPFWFENAYQGPEGVCKQVPRIFFIMKDHGDSLERYNLKELPLEDKKHITRHLFSNIKWGQTFDIKLENILWQPRSKVAYLHDTNDRIFTFATRFEKRNGHYPELLATHEEICTQQIFSVSLLLYELFNGPLPQADLLCARSPQKKDLKIQVPKGALFAKELLLAFEEQLSQQQLLDAVLAVLQDPVKPDLNPDPKTPHFPA